MKNYKIMLLGIVTEAFYELMEATYFEEMGLCSIASYLRKYNYDVKLVQERFSQINYDAIEEYKPDFVSFVVYDMNVENVLMACKEIKKRVEDTKICLGGFYATYNDVRLLEEHNTTDFIVRGEGERTTLELVQHLEQNMDIDNIKGITYKKDGRIIANKDREFIENLDEIPPMARDLLETKGKSALYKGSVGIKTSRGCIGRCTFCGTYEYWKVWRGRSVNLVIDEIQELVSKYNARKYWIFDQSFEDPDINRLSNLINGILEKELDISYYCYMRSGIHKKIDEQLMRSLKRSGLSCVCIGIESGNEEDLRLYEKRATVYDNEKCLELLKKWEVPVDPGFINFNPYSTFEKLGKNVDFLERYGYCCQPSILLQKFLPYTGTSLALRIMKDGLFINQTNEGLKEYKFLDDRINELYHFLSKGMKNASKKDEITFHKIRFNHVYDYQMPLAALRNFVEKKNREDVLSVLKETDEFFNNVFYMLNWKYASSFRALLKLAENNWNEEQALKITSEIINPEEMIEIEKKLITMKKKLIIKLVRMGIPVEEFF